jgi:hypothetical protein
MERTERAEMDGEDGGMGGREGLLNGIVRARN